MSTCCASCGASCAAGAAACASCGAAITAVIGAAASNSGRREYNGPSPLTPRTLIAIAVVLLAVIGVFLYVAH